MRFLQVHASASHPERTTCLTPKLEKRTFISTHSYSTWNTHCEARPYIMYRKRRWRERASEQMHECVHKYVKVVTLEWVCYLYSPLSHPVWQKMSGSEWWNDNWRWGVSSISWTSFGYFKYFSDLKVHNVFCLWATPLMHLNTFFWYS